jgi:hypothetical protein
MSLMPQIANPIGHSHEDVDVSFNVLHNPSPMRGVSNRIGHSHRAIDAHFSVLRGGVTYYYGSTEHLLTSALFARCLKSACLFQIHPPKYSEVNVVVGFSVFGVRKMMSIRCRCPV